MSLHHHEILPDGVFALTDDGATGFLRLSAPKAEDHERILARIIRRTIRLLAGRGLLDDPHPDDALGQLQAETLQSGLSWRVEHRPSSSRLAAHLEGWSLEAGTHVHEHDRLGLLQAHCLSLAAWAGVRRLVSLGWLPVVRQAEERLRYQRGKPC